MIDPSNPDFTNTPASTQRPSFGYALADIAAPPYVTIITPFYNTGPGFHETARSVLQQSFQQWEWLIINDGSTDPEALSILEAYRHSDPRIQVIDHSTNRGLSAARNTGFRSARTQYVVQLDSDDLLEPTAVEKWVWFLESYPEFAFCKGYSVGFGAEQYLWEQGFHSGKAFLDDNQVDVTSMVRKAVHRAVGGYDETDHGGLMDWDFWLRCASHSYWGGTVPEYLDWYRRRPNHKDRWSDFDRGERQQTYRAKLREKYARLWDDGFPEIQLRRQRPNNITSDELPCENRLQKDKPRLLMIVPWLTIGGADKFNLDLLQQLTQRSWEVTQHSMETIPGCRTLPATLRIFSFCTTFCEWLTTRVSYAT
jgi:GT2 family glycosyltransferase